MLNQETSFFFKKALRWNFFGSSFYEITKVFHNFYLLSCMTSHNYGQTGFILSSIYLAARIADLGNAYSTVPLLQDMLRSKKNFRSLIGSFFLLPQIPVLLLGATILSWHIAPELRGLVAAIFMLETYRLFLRYFLHAQFKNSFVVSIELGSFVLFLSAIWIPWLFTGTITPHSILTAHLADSAVATGLLAALSLRAYWLLPSTSSNDTLPSIKNIIASKVYPYFNRLSREITSSNTLTPIYATLFGYANVSIFYFLGIATTAYQMIIKNTITYSSNALLAKLRYESHEQKSYAFHMITDKLLPMLIIPTTVIVMFYTTVNKFIDPMLLKLLFCFLILMGIDLVMHVYEQYYLVQDAARKFFILKMVESAACLAVFYFGPKWSILQAFSTFIAIKAIITLCTALQAYNLWDLRFRVHNAMLWAGITAAASMVIRLIMTIF